MWALTGFVLLIVLSSCSAADLLEVSKKCCPSTDQCCFNSLKNKTRLNCFGDDSKSEALAADCTQKELYGSFSLRFAAFEDSQFCTLFHNYNQADSCKSTCESVMKNPSLSSRQKLEKLKSCKKNNDTYTCFRRAQMWFRAQPAESQASAAFPIHEFCNASAIMQVSRVYLGEQLLR